MDRETNITLRADLRVATMTIKLDGLMPTVRARVEVAPKDSRAVSASFRVTVCPEPGDAALEALTRHVLRAAAEAITPEPEATLPGLTRGA
jgi:hypothetical protein